MIPVRSNYIPAHSIPYHITFKVLAGINGMSGWVVTNGIRLKDLTALFTGYIGEFEYVDDHRGGKIVVELNGRSVSATCIRQCH